MNIFVLDMGPELFWYIGNALGDIEHKLTHFTDFHLAEPKIHNDIPEIIIINADDKNIPCFDLINKIRNHAFLRNISFVVFTANSDFEFKRKLVVQGAAQVFIWNQGIAPPFKQFKETILWLLEYKHSDKIFFETRPYPIEDQIIATTWGRLGYLTEHHLTIESNLDLQIGQKVQISSPLFEELNISQPTFNCQKKNHIGKYYQYQHIYEGAFSSKHTEDDQKKIRQFIQNNGSISKNKNIKIVFFEPTADYRSEIVKTFKADSSYCLRGYKNLQSMSKILDYHRPDLLLVNRTLVQDKVQMDAIKKYQQQNKVSLITYALPVTSNVENFNEIEMALTQELKKNYPFAMHINQKLTFEVIEKMISMLSHKKESGDHQLLSLAFNKHSVYSRLAFHFEAKMTHIYDDGVEILSEIPMGPFCALDFSSLHFSHAQLKRIQLFRTIRSKKVNAQLFSHRTIFIGHSQSDQKKVQNIIEDLEKVPQKI